MEAGRLRSEAQGTFGVATTSHRIASQVAVAMLEHGGNASNVAAAAAGFAHQVVEPDQCRPEGEAVIQVASGKAASPVIICGQKVAPLQRRSAAIELRGSGPCPLWDCWQP